MRLMILAAAICYLLPTPAQAGWVFNLSSSTDLSTLSPGDQFTISVGLSGVAAGDELNFLGAEVLFDAGLLSAVGTPQAGSAIPLASLGGFFGGSGPNFVSGAFDDSFGAFDPITDNGTLFTFNLKAEAAGSGQIVFNSDPFATFALGTDLTGNPIEAISLGLPLDFRISQTTAAVPEPSSLMLFGVGTMGLAICRGRRHRVGAPTGTAA